MTIYAQNIPISRYVDIVSGVAGSANVASRELIGRLMTTNPLLPTQSYVEFTSADDVATYFGSSSTEYLRSAFYFGWVSPNITKASKISFARWADAATASLIYGAAGTYSLSTFTAISAGNLTMTFGGFTFAMTAINLSGAASLAAVAALIQVKIRAQSGGGAAWTSATVVYNATRGSFDFTSGATGADTISMTAATAPDVGAALGWLTGAILSNGSAIETITTTLSNTAQASDNFGSFAFLSTLTQAQIVEAATWNATQNVRFMYSVPVTTANAAAISAAVFTLSGVTLTLSNTAGEYPEQCPMMVLAAVNYTARASVMNYMFKQFTLTPQVITTTDANTYDALRVNYYGRTQSAGQSLSFYQRGYMMGISTSPLDQNVYGNEQWLKSTAIVAIISLLVAQGKVSANIAGAAQISTVLQSVIDQAVFNNTISVGKSLTTNQKIYITTATGDVNAWQQVQTSGYWYGVKLQSYVVNSGTEWKAVYTLIYSKDDDIRKVEGSHQLV